MGEWGKRRDEKREILNFSSTIRPQLSPKYFQANILRWMIPFVSYPRCLLLLHDVCCMSKQHCARARPVDGLTYSHTYSQTVRYLPPWRNNVGAERWSAYTPQKWKRFGLSHQYSTWPGSHRSPNTNFQHQKQCEQGHFAILLRSHNLSNSCRVT